MSISITLLRHGRSRADDEGVYEGRYDSPLTEHGRLQVRLRCNGWRSDGIHFNRIVASPLLRARETAEIIAFGLGCDAPELDPDWMEVDTGPLAGLSFAEGSRLYPRPAFRNPYEQIAGSGESEWELYTRAARALERVVRRGEERVLVVAHAGILNAAMRGVVGAVPGGSGQGFHCAFLDTGYAQLAYLPAKHVWELLEFNAGLHGN